MSPADAGRGPGASRGGDPALPGTGRKGPPPTPSEPPPGGSAVGRRRERLASQRRRRRATILTVASAAVLVVLIGVVLVPLLARGDGGVTNASPPPPPPEPVTEQTLLLVRYDEPGGPATGATLLSARDDGEPSAVIFIPIGLLVDVPGIGLDRLALAYRYGGTELFESTLESTLRVVIDDTAAVSGAQLAALLDQAGALTIDVEERVVVRGEDGEERLVIEPGEQVLQGERLAAYWAYMSESESPLTLHRRQERVLTALFAAIAEDPERLEQFMAQGAEPLETDADLRAVSEVLGGLAQAAADQRVQFEQLPVRPFGGRPTGSQALFRLSDDARSTVHALLPGSAVQGEEVQATRVHVRDGAGRPGVRDAVAAALEGGAFEIVFTDDADGEDHERTEILVADDTLEAMEAAEAVRQRLGVGTIQVTSQEQPAVDVTIVVGSDFWEANDPGADGSQA